MKRFVLAVTIALCLLMTGCSDRVNGQEGYQNQENPIFEDSTQVFSELPLLITGSDSNDRLRYWNCSETDISGVVQPNIHVRFWRDGTGFAGSLDSIWNQTGSHSITVDTLNGKIELNAITFYSIYSNDDQFTATNSSGGVLSCLLRGPARDQIFADYIDNVIEKTTTLNDHMTNKDGEVWVCNETKPTNNTETVWYHFGQDQNALVDGDVGSWFVGDRSEVVVSLPSAVKIIQRVQMGESLDTFSATSLGLNLQCSRTVL